MNYVAPNGIIEIFRGVKLNKDAEDTLHFSTREAQNTYFGSTIISQRLFREENAQNINWRFENNEITVKCPYVELQSANYIRFKNPTLFGDKWIYAFATPLVTSTGATATTLRFEIDDLQTWLVGIDYQLTECRVIRQHQGGYEQIGSNTEPESLQISEYHPNLINGAREVKIDLFEHGYYIAMMLPRTHQGSKLFYGYNNGTYDSTDYKPLNGEGDIPFLQMVDNVPCENVIVLLDMTDTNVPQIGDPEYDGDFPNMRRCWLRFIKINRYWGEYIINSWVISKDVVPTSAISDKVCLSTGSQYSTAQYVVCPNVLFNYTITYTVGDNYTSVYNGDVNANEILKGFEDVTHTYIQFTQRYTVKNKKLFTNPCCLFELIAPNGQIQKLSFENMRADSQDRVNPDYPNKPFAPYFKIVCSILEPKITIMPYGYNRLKYSFDKQSGLPTPPVGASKGTTDNSNIGGLFSSVIEMGATAISTAIGAPAGLTIPSIARQGAMAITQNTMPQGSSNTYNLSNIAMWAENIRYFTGVYMSAENYEALDNFFEAYGYSQNKFKVPTFTRTLWNYFQTDKANFLSISTPADALKRINDKFDKGVRFHESDVTIGNLANYTNGYN